MPTKHTLLAALFAASFLITGCPGGDPDDPGNNDSPAANLPDFGLPDGANPDANIGNRAPTEPDVELVLVEDAPPRTYECVAQGSVDPDGDDLSYVFAWSVNDEAIENAALRYTAATETRGDTLECTVIATDGDLESDSVTAGVELGNHPPLAPMLAVSPEAPSSTDDVECLVETESVDPDGDAVAYSFVWSGPDGASFEGAILTADQTERGDEWTCDVTPSDMETGDVASISIRVGNTAPDAPVVDLSPEQPRTADDVECVVSGDTDPNGDTVTLTYEWSIDGTVSATTDPVLPAVETAKGNTITCTVTSNDGFLDSEAATATTTVENTPPEAPTVTLQPNAPTTNTDLECLAVVPTDIDSDTVALTYSWTVDGSQVSGETTSTLAASHFSKDQTVACEVVADDGTDSTSNSASVVVANTAPGAPVVSITPSTAFTTDDLTCSAAGSVDPDGDSLTFAYSWTVNGTAAGTGTALAAANFARGDTVGCSATASDGNLISPSASDSLVVGNSTPSAPGSVTVTPSSPTTSDDVTCAATGSTDADNDSLTYSYTWTVNGSSAGNGPVLASTEFSKGDAVECAATATDGTDTSAPATTAVTIQNTAPSTPSVAVSPAAPKTTDDLTCAATGSADADGDTISYSYTWTVNGSNAGSTATLLASEFSKGAVVTCEVTASDGDASSPAGTDSVTIENSAPSAPTVAVSPSAAATDDDLACAATGSTDADNDTLTYAYTWTVDGVAAGTGATLASSNFSKGSTVECSATATDGSLTSPASTDSVTIQNTAPTDPTVVVSPPSATTSDSLTCAATGSTDIDGDAVTYTYDWTVNGTAAGSGTSLASSAFAKGDLVVCQVLASDGADSSGPQTDSVTILNSPPTAPTVSISPSAPTTSDNLTCAPAGATDPDGDALIYSYEWRANGSLLAETSSTLGSANISRGDTVACAITVSDGTDNASATNTVTIQNTGPTAPTVTVTPIAPTTSDDVSCAATGSTDADGDSVTYTYVWTVDGVAAGTGSTLASTAYSRANVVECAVTASDGDLTSTAGLDSVTVVNTPPSAPTVSISPATPTTTDSLTCLASGSTDADADALTYSYSWTVNGAAAGTSSTLASTAFAKDDTVVCTVVASDGIDDSSPQTSSVTIENSPPSAPTVSIEPTTANNLDTLTCATTGSVDPDGDTVSYSYVWSVDGTSSGVTSSTVAASNTSIGEVWACTATPSDGTDTGASASASLTIQDACGNGIVDTGEDCDDQNSDNTDGCSSSCQFVSCVGTYVENQFNGVTTYSGTVSNTLPSPVWLDWVTSSKGIQAVNSRLDNLVVTDGSGTVLYSDNFDSAGSWIIRKGSIGTTTISGGTANAGSDWNIFYLGGQPFDPSTGLVVTADVYWSSTTSVFGFFFADVDPAVNTVSNEILGGSHDLQLYASGSGPAVSAVFDDLAGGGIIDTSSWSEPAVGWHEMSVRIEPQCTCGDGVVDAGEVCDDGNVTDGDGCSSTCVTEYASSCAAILSEDSGASDGVYTIDPDGAGVGVPAIDVYCDMTTDDGGWTRVVNITPNSSAHKGNTGSYGDVSVDMQTAKLSDAVINQLTTLPYWRFRCGTTKDAFVRNSANTWTSLGTNSENWSIDDDKDLVFECAANRTDFVFSEAYGGPGCFTGHTNYAAGSGAPCLDCGCYVDGEGWYQSGTLWVK